jgi:hypothetical protein
MGLSGQQHSPYLIFIQTHPIPFHTLHSQPPTSTMANPGPLPVAMRMEGLHVTPTTPFEIVVHNELRQFWGTMTLLEQKKTRSYAKRMGPLAKPRIDRWRPAGEPWLKRCFWARMTRAFPRCLSCQVSRRAMPTGGHMRILMSHAPKAYLPCGCKYHDAFAEAWLIGIGVWTIRRPNGKIAVCISYTIVNSNPANGSIQPMGKYRDDIIKVLKKGMGITTIQPRRLIAVQRPYIFPSM